MVKCYKKYLTPKLSETQNPLQVVEVGSADVNGSYRTIFPRDHFKYIGVDLASGNGVDIVLNDPYHLPFPSCSVDIVVSGQMFEHCEFFWKAFEEMMRILKREGFLFLIAPSSGPIHRFPVDCYRFFPDSFNALARYVGCHLVECWQDQRGPWNDLVGVFQHFASEIPSSKNSQTLKLGDGPQSLNSSSSLSINSQERIGVDFENRGDETTSGAIDYLEVMKILHQKMYPSLYLEIGIGKGNSFYLASCEALGIDPTPGTTLGLGANSTIFSMESDEFFETIANDVITRPIDLAFIDGMHLFENCLRDFMNLERFCSRRAAIVVDDIFPNSIAQSSRTRRTRIWTGDVWKLIYCLREFRSDLQLSLIDAHPTGLLVVTNLNPEDITIREYYNTIIRRYSTEAFSLPPKEIFHRDGAIKLDKRGCSRMPLI
jgi:hypothetical protein